MRPVYCGKPSSGRATSLPGAVRDDREWCSRIQAFRAINEENARDLCLTLTLRIFGHGGSASRSHHGGE